MRRALYFLGTHSLSVTEDLLAPTNDFLSFRINITHWILRYFADTEFSKNNKHFRPCFSIRGIKIEDKSQLRPFLQFAGLKTCSQLRQTACFLNLPSRNPQLVSIFPRTAPHISQGWALQPAYTTEPSIPSQTTAAAAVGKILAQVSSLLTLEPRFAMLFSPLVLWNMDL